MCLEVRNVTSSTSDEEEGIAQQRMRLGTSKAAFTNDVSKNEGILLLRPF